MGRSEMCSGKKGSTLVKVFDNEAHVDVMEKQER